MKKKDNTSIGEVNANRHSHISLELEYKGVEFLILKFN